MRENFVKGVNIEFPSDKGWVELKSVIDLGALEEEKPFQAIDKRAFLYLNWKKKEVVVTSENANKILGEIEIEEKGEELKIKLKTS